MKTPLLTRVHEKFLAPSYGLLLPFNRIPVFGGENTSTTGRKIFTEVSLQIVSARGFHMIVLSPQLRLPLGTPVPIVRSGDDMKTGNAGTSRPSFLPFHFPLTHARAFFPPPSSLASSLPTNLILRVLSYPPYGARE